MNDPWVDRAGDMTYEGDMEDAEMASDEFRLEFYDWKIQNYKGRDGYGFSADIPLRFSTEAARLLIESQRTGSKIVLKAEIVPSQEGDLQ